MYRHTGHPRPLFRLAITACHSCPLLHFHHTLLPLFSVTSDAVKSPFLVECHSFASLGLIVAKSLPKVDDLNNIFNDNLLEINKSFKNYLSNFEDWKLRMKIALLNNCGYVDNEQNNKKVKELLLSIDNVNISSKVFNADIHDSAEYRAHIIKVMAKKAVSSC